MRLVSLLVCLLPVSLVAFSEGGAATITGKVRDVSGAALSGATVEVKNPQGRTVVSIVSASTGDYSVPQLPAGNYAITVKMKGMKTYAHAYLTVDKPTVIREDVTLEVDENPVVALPDDPAPIPVRSRVPSKDFYAADSELELTKPLLILQGRELELQQEPEPVKGHVVWLYVPGHGRYLMSLAPHAELGFSLAGQVGGTSLWFKLQGEDIQVDSDERIAPGSATYNVYVLHEPDWQPSGETVPSSARMGSGGK